MLVQALKSSYCRELYLNGSFVTNKKEPEDFDAVWDPEGVDNTIDPVLRDMKARRDDRKKKYGGDIFILEPEGLAMNHLEFFQRDGRTDKVKGIILVELL